MQTFFIHVQKEAKKNQESFFSNLTDPTELPYFYLIVTSDAKI